MDRYALPSIRSLVLQLMRGPRRLRLRQLLSIEFLLSVIEGQREYPYEFVCHALTGFRPTSALGNGRLLDGQSLVSDLVVLAEDISADAGLVLQLWPEPVYAVHDLADRFDVSTKTIFRWRRRGLAGWRFLVEDRRTRLLFVDRCVRRFVAQNTGLVTRGGNFSQLTPAERERILVRARELAGGDGYRTVNAVARTIAGEAGRAVETIRLILKHHDEANPGAGIFNRSPLQVEANDQRLAVWEAYTEGTSVEALAVRFERPIAWVYQTITQMRARELRVRKIESVGSPDFEAPDAEQTILHPAPSVPLYRETPPTARRAPSALPAYLANLFRLPLLTPEGEFILFRRMNYLRHKARQAVERLDPDTVSAAELDRIEGWLRQAEAVKNEIVQANLRLVVSIAKRHVQPRQDLFELISDGNVSLMRAVDKFDYTRGFKFSTYASWAIMKNFARSIPESRRHADRYQTGWDEVLETVGATLPEEHNGEHLAVVRRSLDRMLATLDPRERAILRQRYGLDDAGAPRTLEQIGQRFGVSKERVRQLESRALLKLRGDFEAEAEELVGA
ncbi:MAG: sigma-70 family RNA polymerase sigma factor [Planctomycetota bacterium]